jgi:1-acyl-sn-glycerol-3-phosphate acyltransferase
MLYYILRPIARLFLKIYYKKIHIIGMEHIPKDRPLLIASNHPNGFLEPCVMACFFPISLHFLTRGDLFNNPVLKVILDSTHQIPIFRFRDGFNALRKNKENLDIANDKLNRGAAILIFIEGSTEFVRKLRKFQKGLGRMAKSLLEENEDSNLGMLPIAINFSDPNKFRSSVIVKVFPVKEPNEYEILGENKEVNKEISRLTNDMYATIKEGVLHLDNSDNEKVFNTWYPRFMYASYPDTHPIMNKDEEILSRGKKLAELLDNDEPNNLSAFLKKESVLNKLTDQHYFWNEDQKKGNIFLQVVLFPFLILATIVNIIPISLSKYITNKTVKKKVFYSSVLIAAVLTMYSVYILLLFILGLVVSKYFLIIIVLIPISIYLSILYFENKDRRDYKNAWKDFTEEEQKNLSAIKAYLGE